MHKDSAIVLKNVSKIYRLYGSQSDQLIEVLGLQRLGFRAKSPHTEFSALSNISIEVPRGHRVGIIGRNGAGKTTLLKLICGNFAPTSGEVSVRGTVQALMSMGLGFHPEYTGRQNAESSLQYNGLSKLEYQKALDGVIDFCELDQFLDQPFKTYSLGMQARLMFAVATAIHPDILIVDEALGAGDAYFVAKSKRRVEAMINNGCTMLLVSHSMQQVLELCNEVIWMDGGRIRMHGESFEVVKAYEEFMHGSIASDLDSSGAIYEKGLESEILEFNKIQSPIVDNHPSDKVRMRTIHEVEKLNLQEPNFLPHSRDPSFSPSIFLNGFSDIAVGGISRWESDAGLKIMGFKCYTQFGEGGILTSMVPAKFLITIKAEHAGEFDCRYGVCFFDLMGACVARIISPKDSFSIQSGQCRNVEMILNPNQLGPGEYILSLSIHQFGLLELFNSTPRYDLLNRSFHIKVEMPDSLAAVEAKFFHSAEWSFLDNKKLTEV